METGIIFDIKEFAVYDGPGMRQTVFFKGCALRCSWCHNPEGLSAAPQLMVSQASCTGCGRCIQACGHAQKYLREDMQTDTQKQRQKHIQEPLEKHPQECTADLLQTSSQTHPHGYIPVSCAACGACIPVCPLHLRRIAGERITSEELARRIRKDSAYYARYGGGVTFSGGEPLMQAEFLLEVLQKLPDLHRAIETSGYCRPELFRKVAAELDYILMDIKLFDSAKHRRYTGVDNAVILQNAAFLRDGDIPFVIRIPVIPGVNDNEDNYTDTAAFLAGARALERVEFLPYHKTAGAKYTMVGKEYRPDFDPEQGIRISQRIFEQYGIKSIIM